jgi:hypothetical protein
VADTLATAYFKFCRSSNGCAPARFERRSLSLNAAQAVCYHASRSRPSLLDIAKGIH